MWTVILITGLVICVVVIFLLVDYQKDGESLGMFQEELEDQELEGMYDDTVDEVDEEQCEEELEDTCQEDDGCQDIYEEVALEACEVEEVESPPQKVEAVATEKAVEKEEDEQVEDHEGDIFETSIMEEDSDEEEVKE